MMWKFVITLAILSSVTATSQAQTEPAVAANAAPLTTKIDSDVALMFDTIVTSLLKKLPGSSEQTQATLLMDSNLAQGQVKADFVLSTDAAGAALTAGRLNVQFLNAQDSQVDVLIDTMISLPRAEFMTSLQGLINGLLTDKAIPTTVAIQDLQTFKSELIRVLDSAQPTTKKKRQSFGGGSSSSDSSGLSTEKVEILKSLIQSSLLVEQSGNSQTLTVDLLQVQSQNEALHGVSEIFSKLLPLQSLKIELSDLNVVVSVSSTHSIPQNTLAVYDSYLSQQQGGTSGLQPLSSLIQKLGPWVVGRCANAEYRSICIEKLIYSCAKNLDRVANCVADAESIQRAREARAEGDTLGAISNSADALINSTGQKIEDQVDGLINWATGNDSTTGQGE